MPGAEHAVGRDASTCVACTAVEEWRGRDASCPVSLLISIAPAANNPPACLLACLLYPPPLPRSHQHEQEQGVGPGCPAAAAAAPIAALAALAGAAAAALPPAALAPAATAPAVPAGAAPARRGSLVTLAGPQLNLQRGGHLPLRLFHHGGWRATTQQELLHHWLSGWCRAAAWGLAGLRRGTWHGRASTASRRPPSRAILHMPCSASLCPRRAPPRRASRSGTSRGCRPRPPTPPRSAA